MFCTKMNRLLGICGLLLSLWAVCIDSATQPPDNVDRIEPVVRRSPDPNKADQFGFSVALHQIAEPTDFVSAISNTRYVAFGRFVSRKVELGALSNQKCIKRVKDLAEKEYRVNVNCVFDTTLLLS